MAFVVGHLKTSIYSSLSFHPFLCFIFCLESEKERELYVWTLSLYFDREGAW